jgi:hypothetical protein
MLASVIPSPGINATAASENIFEVLFNKLEVSVSAYKLEKENTVNMIKVLKKIFHSNAYTNFSE